MDSMRAPQLKASVMAVLISVVTFVPAADCQIIDQVQQGLVTSAPVMSAAEQEKYTLVTVNSGCSGSLLRNEWVVTAAHCVDDEDPKKPGTFIPAADDSVIVTAAWTTKQERHSIRIISFRPHDLAIIRVDAPFKVNGSTRNFNRDIFRDGQFPYFGQLVPVPIKVFGRGISKFAQGTGATATPVQRDGQFRAGSFRTASERLGKYWYASSSTLGVARGDSGGPSFATVRGADEVLMGVHSTCISTCLEGKMCQWSGEGPEPEGYDEWQWVSGTTECSDTPIAPDWDEINRYLGVFTPESDPPAPPFIGTFAVTPPNYRPIWVYAIKNDGDMLWYRKDTGTSLWQGPKKVGNGWNFKDVIPAGGNSFYALTAEGKLMWYRHDGFNDGSARAWQAPVEVGHGWGFKQIFSGGEGIVYAIKDDGELMWYRHGGYADGGGPSTWSAPRSVGNGWGFKDVFSNGGGQIYAVTNTGELLYYYHAGFATGERSFRTRKTLATGWDKFREIVPAGDGVILAVRDDGKLLWYRHYLKAPNRYGRVVEHWEGPVEIGSGWTGFKKIVALLPVASAGVVR